MKKFKFEINYSKNLEEKIFQKLNHSGVAFIKNVISLKDLNNLQNIVKNSISKNGERYFTILNPLNKEFNLLKEDKEFFLLSKNISEKKLSRTIRKEDFLSVLRVITGDKTKEKSYQFHFDAYILTILIPIFIPQTQSDNGHLILYPNLRKKIRYSFINFLEKIFYQNYLSRTIIKNLLKKSVNKNIIKLKPGNIYFFWGYQSLHANLPIDPKLLRSTLLLHFGTVHDNSFADKFIKKFRHRMELKNAQNHN